MDTVAGDDAVGGPFVFDLEHGAFVGRSVGARDGFATAGRVERVSATSHLALRSIPSRVTARRDADPSPESLDPLLERLDPC